jgi:hypothetical protein
MGKKFLMFPTATTRKDAAGSDGKDYVFTDWQPVGKFYNRNQRKTHDNYMIFKNYFRETGLTS